VDEAYATAISVISSRLRNTWLSRSPTAIFVGQEWSPDWSFTDDEFAATATSFDNPDFVDVVVHSYRHRYGLAAGGPACQGLEGATALPTCLQLKTRPQGVDGTLFAVEFDSP
jgi:hypothetical protein